MFLLFFHTVPPHFVNFPVDQIIELGDTVELQCVVTGDPQPDTEWVKDGEQIVLGKQHS